MKNDLQNFGEEFFKIVREKEVWKKISMNKELPWNIKLIEKYSDKLDWEELCENHGIIWDAVSIEKFRFKINWNALSGSILWQVNSSGSFDWSLLKKYERFWNWTELSRRSGYIPTDILELYADKWDWAELIDNRDINWTYSIFERFKNHIPISDFENLKRSQLWDNLINIDEQIITGKILAE